VAAATVRTLPNRGIGPVLSSFTFLHITMGSKQLSCRRGEGAGAALRGTSPVPTSAQDWQSRSAVWPISSVSADRNPRLFAADPMEVVFAGGAPSSAHRVQNGAVVRSRRADKASENRQEGKAEEQGV